MPTELTPQGQCLDEYTDNEQYSEVHYKRAIGELPEMESSKAIAELIAATIRPGESIADIGCGGGHYLRSLKRIIPTPFTYVGVDPYPMFLDKAKKAWADEPAASFELGWVHDLPLADDSHDVVMCNNVLTHVPSIVQPLAELIRVARRQVVVRTPIYEMSYRIQLVYNNTFWPYTSVPPEDEFDDEGEPRSFSYFDIHSRDYFTSVIRRHAPDARIEYIVDDRFDAAKINESAEKEGSVAATRVLGGMQVTGCILLPHHFVVIDL